MGFEVSYCAWSLFMCWAFFFSFFLLLDKALQNPAVSWLELEPCLESGEHSPWFQHPCLAAASLWKYTILLQSHEGLTESLAHLTWLCCSSSYYPRSLLN